MSSYLNCPLCTWSHPFLVFHLKVTVMEEIIRMADCNHLKNLKNLLDGKENFVRIILIESFGADRTRMVTIDTFIPYIKVQILLSLSPYISSKRFVSVISLHNSVYQTSSYL